MKHNSTNGTTEKFHTTIAHRPSHRSVTPAEQPKGASISAMKPGSDAVVTNTRVTSESTQAMQLGPHIHNQAQNQAGQPSKGYVRGTHVPITASTLARHTNIEPTQTESCRVPQLTTPATTHQHRHIRRHQAAPSTAAARVRATRVLSDIELSSNPAKHMTTVARERIEAGATHQKHLRVDAPNKQRA